MNDNNRFKCLKSTDNTNKDSNYTRPNRFRDRQQNTRWKRSNSPPSKNFRVSDQPVRSINSRWKRDDEPSRNSFLNKNRDHGSFHERNNDRKNGRRGRYVGFGKNRKYLGKGKPSIFDGAEKDSNGLPIIAGSTQKTFDIMASLQKAKPQKKRKNKTPKKNLVKLEKKQDSKLLFEKEEKTQEQINKEKEWQKAMLMQYQMYTDSEEEEVEQDIESE